MSFRFPYIYLCNNMLKISTGRKEPSGWGKTLLWCMAEGQKGKPKRSTWGATKRTRKNVRGGQEKARAEKGRREGNRPVATPSGGGGQDSQMEVFVAASSWGGRTWRKWTKYILTAKVFLKKVILTKFWNFGELGDQDTPALATGLT